jgi:hypothetical protein
VSDQERCFALVKRLAGYGMFSTGKAEHGQYVIVIPHWSFDLLEEFMDRDRFSDDYDPEPDYDRPSSNLEAMRDELLVTPIPPKSEKENTVSDPNAYDLAHGNDPTEAARRSMIETGQPVVDLEATDGPTWTSETVQSEFEIIGFMAPFVVARRRSDGVKGSLEFTHNPRVYFNWQPSS